MPPGGRAPGSRIKILMASATPASRAGRCCDRRRHYWSVIIPWAGPTARRYHRPEHPTSTGLHARSREELQRQARADSLTGIANRRSFYENAGWNLHSHYGAGAEPDHHRHRLLPGRSTTPWATPWATACCRRFVACCQDALRNDGLLARTGGEEFASCCRHGSGCGPTYCRAHPRADGRGA